MKSLIAVLFLLISVNTWSVTLAPKLDGTDQIRFSKYLEAVSLVEKVVNSEAFKAKVIATQFKSTSDSGEQVYKKIMEGSELLSPGVNYQWDFGVGFYYKKFSKTVGWTDKTTHILWVNTAKFDSMELSDIAANIAHEYTHKIGYEHDFRNTAIRPYSVPYQVGGIVKFLIKNENDKQVVPEASKEVSMKPSFFQRLKNLVINIFW